MVAGDCMLWCQHEVGYGFCAYNLEPVYLPPHKEARRLVHRCHNQDNRIRQYESKSFQGEHHEQSLEQYIVPYYADIDEIGCASPQR